VSCNHFRISALCPVLTQSIGKARMLYYIHALNVEQNVNKVSRIEVMKYSPFSFEYFFREVDIVFLQKMNKKNQFFPSY
jgi:hypothetical protein